MHSIIGIKKQSKNKIASVDGHNRRLFKNEPNVDYSRTHLNRTLVGDTRTLMSSINTRINSAKLDRKVRTDAIYGIEFMLTASPEFFDEAARAGDSEQLDAWIAANLEFLVKTCGAENIMQCILHMDETTPHLQVVICPIVTIDNRVCMNANVYAAHGAYGRLQSSYAEAMGRFGLKRGVVDSPNKNQSIKAGRAEVAGLANSAMEAATRALDVANASSQRVEVILTKTMALNASQSAVIAEQAMVIYQQREAIKRLTEHLDRTGGTTTLNYDDRAAMTALGL